MIAQVEVLVFSFLYLEWTCIPTNSAKATKGTPKWDTKLLPNKSMSFVIFVTATLNNQWKMIRQSH